MLGLVFGVAAAVDPVAVAAEAPDAVSILFRPPHGTNKRSLVARGQVAFGALMRDTSTGLFITRGLLSALCGAMPSWMMDDLVATVRSLFDALLPTAVSGWIEAVLNDPSFER